MAREVEQPVYQQGEQQNQKDVDDIVGLENGSQEAVRPAQKLDHPAAGGILAVFQALGFLWAEGEERSFASAHHRRAEKQQQNE